MDWLLSELLLLLPLLLPLLLLLLFPPPLVNKEEIQLKMAIMGANTNITKDMTLSEVEEEDWLDIEAFELP